MSLTEYCTRCAMPGHDAGDPHDDQPAEVWCWRCEAPAVTTYNGEWLCAEDAATLAFKLTASGWVRPA